MPTLPKPSVPASVCREGFRMTTDRFSSPVETRSKFYPFRMSGQTTVKCKTCGRSGLTSRRLVGRARIIDKCGECLQTQPKEIT